MAHVHGTLVGKGLLLCSLQVLPTSAAGTGGEGLAGQTGGSGEDQARQGEAAATRGETGPGVGEAQVEGGEGETAETSDQAEQVRDVIIGTSGR